MKEEPIIILGKNEQIFIYNDLEITIISNEEDNTITFIKNYFKENRIEIKKI